MARKRKLALARQQMAPPRRSSPHRNSVATAHLSKTGGDVPEPVPTRSGFQKTLLPIASFAMTYVGDVLHTALWLLKKPLGLIFSTLLLVFALDFVIVKSRSALSPLCILPFVSSSAICSRHYATPLDTKTSKSPEFGRLIEVQDGFQGIMNINAGTSEIGLKLKQSEMATRDLVTLVSVSDLEYREPLMEALMRFVEDARKAGEGLHRLSAKIDGAVDR